MVWLGYALGLLAAMSNAAASVLQRVANRDEDEDRRFSWQLVKDLLHKPVWFGGVAFMTLSFFLQASGLGFATLAAVEPLLVLELPLALLAAWLWLHQDLDRRAWLSIAGMSGGTIALIAVLGPTPGTTTSISWWVYLIAIGVTVTIMAACYLYGRAAGVSNRRAVVLGIGTGVAFGLSAALVKGMTTQFSSGGVVGALTTWQLYAAIVAGVAAVWMQQNAVGSGRLVVSQPGITLGDPYTSILWGAFVFHEHMRGGLWLVAAAVAAVVMTGSAVLMSRTRAVERAQDPYGESPADSSSRPRSSASTTA